MGTRKKKIARNEPRFSRLHAPRDMAVAEWQAVLRRQFGAEQKFTLENTGAEPVFSEFRVTNPASGGRYRVAIRGAGLGENYCSCPDFATNELGTCKHVEFALAKLARKRGGRAAHQELGHDRRVGVEAPRNSLRIRIDGHVAGKPPGRARLHRPVCRSAPPGSDLAPARRASGA